MNSLIRGNVSLCFFLYSKFRHRSLFKRMIVCVLKHIIIIIWNIDRSEEKKIVCPNWNNKLSTIVLTELAYVKCQLKPVYTSNQCSCSCTSKNKAFLYTFIIFSASYHFAKALLCTVCECIVYWCCVPFEKWHS